ncbi:Uncharacterized protein Rs2_09490 [Raphanus sativus]|nr:Uncharacterized protein Rs2_09490 [Raphanus sativus]
MRKSLSGEIGGDDGVNRGMTKRGKATSDSFIVVLHSLQKDLLTYISFSAYIITSEQKWLPLLSHASDWVLDTASGYYYNQTNGLHYDSKSGFYYSDSIGRWVTQDEAYAAVKSSSDKDTKVPLVKKPVTSLEAGPSTAKPPGRVVSATLNPKRNVKGAASSVEIGNKRKRIDEKPKKVSAEKKAALRAREAARYTI